MAEQTRGGQFRERIAFEANLWHEIEALAAHMHLEPRELVKLLTAIGVTQMKALTQMNAPSAAVQAAVTQDMNEDYERTTGQPASAPLARQAAARPTPVQPAPVRPAPLAAPGRGSNEPRQTAASVTGSFLTGRDGRPL